MQTEQFDLFRDYEDLQQEILVLSKEQSLRIEIDIGLHNALKELESLKAQMPQEKMQNLFELCEENVINTLKRQFGASVLFETSKEGGQVSTTHNARKGIYANEKEGQAYENRGEYNSHEYHSDKQYTQINKEQRMLKKQGGVVDYMTGKSIKRNAEVDLDHKISAKSIHDDGARVLAELDGKALANTKDNLALTDASLNKMKEAKSPEKFIEYKHKKLKEFQIKQEKGTLTPNEERKMQKLKSIDDERFLKDAKEARNKIDNTIDKAYYTSSKPYKELGIATLEDAKGIAQGGLKSAIMIVLSRLIKELFAEIRHIFKHFGDESFSEIFARLKERLGRVISEIKQDFKGIFEGSIEQSIGAFLSNIVLFIINIFVSTAKRITQIIRAGFDSLVRAIKILANPPANMPKDEVAFEALKVFTAGIITAGSLFLEEGIDKFITTICPFLVPISPIIATTLSALIGGVLSTIALYYIDKAFNGGKYDNLQIQIMTKGGEVVHYKIAQTYFMLKDSFEYLSKAYEETDLLLKTTSSEIKKSSQEAKTSLNELTEIMKKLKEKK